MTVLQRGYMHCTATDTAIATRTSSCNSNKLLQPLSIPTPVELAVKLRDKLKTRCSDAAMFLQQLHYWITKQQGRLVKGVRWIHNTYVQWLDQFPWWREWDFRVITKALREEGLIEFKQLNDHGRDRTGYYTLNYDHEWLKDLSFNNSDAAESTALVHPSTVLECNRTETTPKTTTDIKPEWKQVKKAVKKAIPIPTIEQMLQLEEMKAAHKLYSILYQGEMVVVDIGDGKTVPWWKYLGIQI